MKLQSKIGLLGAVAIVVGGVIGMGAYALIPGIAAKAGNAAWLAIGIALLVSLLGVLPLIQLSSALPVAGGGYLYGTRLLGPLPGVLVSYWAILGGASSVGLVAYGLADLWKAALPFPISLHLLAALLIALFYIVYLFGVNLLTALQIVMAIQMLIALFAYAAGPLFQPNIAWHFSMPTAADTFLVAVILSFNVSLGFQVITELGEDIKKPKRNIPLSLIIGATVVLVVYIGITMTYIGSVGLDNLTDFGRKNAALIESSKSFLPPWGVWWLALGAVSAGLTSLNAGAIALPRELFSQARDRFIPPYFAQLHPRTQSPMRAVTAFFLFVILLLLTGHVLDKMGLLGKEPIEFYGYMAAMGIMMLTVFISLASLRLPKKYPTFYQSANFRLSKPVLWVLVVLSVISSGGFALLVGASDTLVAGVYIIYTTVVVVYFFQRKKWLAAREIVIAKNFDITEGAH